MQEDEGVPGHRASQYLLLATGKREEFQILLKGERRQSKNEKRE